MKILFSFLFTLFLCSHSFAWTVMVLRGSKIELQNSKLGAATKLKVGAVLQSGDLIKTGPGSLVKLMKNKSVLIVAENSSLRLKEPTQESEENLPTLHLDAGKMRVHVEKTEARLFKFRIPSIVAGVRGTEFFMLASKEKEVLCVLDGSVNAYEIATKGRAVVEKNIGWIREGETPGQLLPTTTEQRADWIRATSL